jgi:hypothetical protein
MDCAAIQKLLSEYIDGTLDAKSVQVVERHVSVCEDCKETLASLTAIVEELNTLEPVEPPADFLEKIHQRMEPRFDLNRILRKLFVPFKIKIPLQLAAAATASILVVMVLNIQKSEYQKIQPLEAAKSEQLAEKPKSNHPISEFKTKTKPPAPALEEAPRRLSDSEQGVTAKRSREKTLLQPSIQKESEPHPSALAKARPSAEKGYPMELSLFLNPIIIGNANAPDIGVQRMPLHENDKKTIEKEKTDKDTLERKFSYKQESHVDDLLFKMNQIIRPLNGKILTKEYDKHKDRVTSIQVQMPAKNYASFCKELSRLGTFKTPPPALFDQSVEMLDLLINFTYPKQ